MIGTNPEMTKRVASQLRARSQAFAFPVGAETLCIQLLETLDSAAFPGALLPEQTADGEFFVVAVALPSDWRRLCPVLRAFAGPTLTSFDGLPSSDLVAPDLLAVLSEAGNCVISAIKVPTEQGGREMALRALVRARDTFARAPSLTRATPEPTSWLLARFQDHLNVGHRDGAAALLFRLRDELRLDALNLRALEIQLLATFNDWSGIVNLSGFANLTWARRTPATTALLLEALYQVYLATAFETGSWASVETIYAQQVRTLAAPMLKAPFPASLRAGGWRLASLELLTSSAREDLRTGVAAQANLLGWLATRLAAVSSPEQSPVPRLDSTDQARECLIAGEGRQSVDVMSAALAALARLDDTQRAELARAEPFCSALRALEQEAGSESVPNSWPMWLTRISDPSFTNALALARMGAEEWPIAGDATDPVEVASLLNALNRAQSDSLAAERTTQALPYIIAALQRDSLFPNSTMKPIYSTLLTLLALGSGRGILIYDSSIVLVEALLSIGTDSAQYREIVADVGELAGEGFGGRMVYWVLELIEAFMISPAPDAMARERLVHSMLARLTPLYWRLSCVQKASIHSLCNEFGWIIDASSAQQRADDGAFSLRLRGKTIMIYSLIENAARKAKLSLMSLSNELVVHCSADHCGTAQLRSLAVNSDLVVVAWSAAKHAATDFIRTHRGGKALVYARGKGTVSILRAVEEHFSVGS